MAARAPRPVFAHRRTVRLAVDDDMAIDVLQVIRSLPDFQEDITGVMPQFGGKCIDITLRDPEVAARLALSGFDYENVHKPLRLLGEKSIHVSVFVPVEFPDETVVALLKEYGELKSTNLRRLYYKEEGFAHIERGIRVAEFRRLHRDVPRRIATQGVEINIKYTGQPATCHRCHSTEHLVRNCPKQRVRTTRSAESGGEATRPPPAPPSTEETENSEEMEFSDQPPTSETDETEAEDTPSPPRSYASVSASTPAVSPSMVSRDLFDATPQSRKRPSASPEKADKPEAKQRAVEAEHPKENPALKLFITALKQAGPDRTKLMNAIPGSKYYRFRALYLQHKHGNFADLELRSAARRGLSERETDAWTELHGTISQDAFAELIRICEELGRANPGLFKN